MRKLWYDLKVFYILRSEVRKHRESPDWLKYNLRHDWLYRIYTVVNPTEKDKGDDDAMIQMKATDRLTPVSKYILSMGLGEILSLSMERVPDTNSFLAVYYPIYRWLTPWRILSRSIFLILCIWALVHFLPIISQFVENYF
jgi:hypothetical protein